MKLNLFPRRILLIGLLAGIAHGAAAFDDREAVITSDGHVPAAAEAAVSGAPSFGGERLRGQKLDAQAEFPAERATRAEMQDFAARRSPQLPGGDSLASNVVTRSVVGVDRRFRVYSQQSFPQRAIGMITYGSDNSQGCTGWLASKDTVITAGHCVHDGAGGSFKNVARFYPARDGSSSPYGSCTVKRLYTVAGWSRDGNRDFDYGAIKLNCTIGNTTGWFGRIVDSTSPVGRGLMVSGFPCDKTAATQWAGTGKVSSATTNRLFYTLDTAPCQSGSPVIEVDRQLTGCDASCVAAIHTTGGGSSNGSTRITSGINSFLQQWIDDAQ